MSTGRKRFLHVLSRGSRGSLGPRGALVLLSVATMAIVPGCSDEPHSPENHQNDGATVGCEADPRVTAYVAGLSAKDPGGSFNAEIMAADPAPPKKGMNSWTMKFSDGAAPPAETITVSTVMPDHGHGSARVPKVVNNPDGTTTVSEIYLFMGGVWEVAFTSGTKTARFTLCVN